MSDQSPRWAFPLLQPGQAQKELFHNEAIVAIDLLVQTVVASASLDAPPDAPESGECWIVGSGASDGWTGKAGYLAGWTDGGWRFVAPAEGMAAWIVDRGLPARFADGRWIIGDLDCGRVVIDGNQVVGPRQEGIAAPAGGSVVDVEARSAIAAILSMARAHGLLEP